MSLWHIYSQTDMIAAYPLETRNIPVQPGGWFKGTYAFSLHTPRVFFYVPERDCFILWATMSYMVWIPGKWIGSSKNVRLFMDAESGSPFYWEAPFSAAFPDMLAWGLWGGSVGSYDRIYVTRTAWAYPCVDEAFYLTLEWTGDWRVCANADTIPTSGFGGWGPHVVVNREDGYITWGGGKILNIFKLNSQDEKWHRQHQISTLGSMDYCCYENRDYCWWISTPGAGHKIGKLNYRQARHEILTSVQTPYSDVSRNLLAFDTKRKRLAVLRIRPNDLNTGACRWVMDFYRPIIKVSSLGLTDPVPVVSPRAGNRMVFVAYLIGDVGEALAPHTITASMEAPVEGKLLTPLVTSDRQGKLQALYQALAPGQEKLTLSAEVTDGDSATMEW